jgi:type IV secretory pathway component VirB8
LAPKQSDFTVEQLSQDELVAHVASTRARLASTLDALEDKANLPKQFKKGATAQAVRLRKLRSDKPLVFAAVVVGGAVVAAGILALVVKSATKR